MCNEVNGPRPIAKKGLPAGTRGRASLRVLLRVSSHGTPALPGSISVDDPDTRNQSHHSRADRQPYPISQGHVSPSLSTSTPSHANTPLVLSQAAGAVV
jgi:hypothetical protein